MPSVTQGLAEGHPAGKVVEVAAMESLDGKWLAAEEGRIEKGFTVKGLPSQGCGHDVIAKSLSPSAMEKTISIVDGDFFFFFQLIWKRSWIF
ncbi:hypothetical protein ACOSQ4_031324 [Xanthoceras sorbifolium]